jgi:hypothetical protein
MGFPFHEAQLLMRRLQKDHANVVRLTPCSAHSQSHAAHAHARPVRGATARRRLRLSQSASR